MHFLCHFYLELELELESELQLESKLEFGLPWRVVNTELLVGEVVGDACCMR